MRRLRDGHTDVDDATRGLTRARDTLRNLEILHTVIHLDDPSQRATGLRVATTWHGTPDELLTVLSQLTDADR